MRIDVWSDIACPFCWIGKNELATAIARFEHADEVEVAFHSYELQPELAASEPYLDAIAARYSTDTASMKEQMDQIAARGESIGLHFDWDKAVVANTFDAHRLVKLAETEGKGAEAIERFMTANFSEGVDVSDREQLKKLAMELGLDAARVDEVLASDEFGDEVRDDEKESQKLGIGGVPFFVFEGQWAVNGAQPASMFDAALDEVWAETHKPQFLTLGGITETGGGCCGGGGCGCGH